MCAGAAVALLGTYDAAGDHYLPAPWGAALFVLACAACVAYGYGRGQRRAIWTGAWVSVLAIVVLELIAHALGAGDVGNPDPDDPVMSPVAWLVVLPVFWLSSSPELACADGRIAGSQRPQSLWTKSAVDELPLAAPEGWFGAPAYVATMSACAVVGPRRHGEQH